MIKTQTQLLPSAALEWLRAFQQGHGKLLRVVLYVFVILWLLALSDTGRFRVTMVPGDSH